MAGERDHLLDAARAVGEANRRRQQARPERDPLLGGVDAQRVGVTRDRVERLPDRRGALRPVAAGAVALVERLLELEAVEALEILLDVPEATVGEVARGARVTADQRLQALDRQRDLRQA